MQALEQKQKNTRTEFTMRCFKLIFLFASAVFLCLSNNIALKGCLLQHCKVFLLLFCVAIVISEPGAYFRPDFGAIGGRSLRLDKMRDPGNEVASTLEIKISRVYF